MSESDWLTERFERHRFQLHSVAYRILGSAPDAEDAVQEAWLRASRAYGRRDREPARVADHDRGPRQFEYAARSRRATRNPHSPRRTDRADCSRGAAADTGGRGRSRRIRRAGDARRARDALAGRAARVRVA
ncbi:MAG: sigma factor [Tetrasphaera sp.]